MATPWPQWLTTSFLAANQPQLSNDESEFYGPYVRLLYYLFGLEGPYDIIPQFDFPEGFRGPIDVDAIVTVEYNKHLVLLVQVKAPASFKLDTKRKVAYEQMRDRLVDLIPNMITSRLLGISAFGTRLAFYKYDAADNSLTPPLIFPHPVYLNELAPAERWSYDVLEPEGIAQIRKVVEDVKSMCEASSV